MSNRLASRFVAEWIEHFAPQELTERDFNCDIDVAIKNHMNKLLVVLIAKSTWLLKTILRKEYYGNSNNNQYVYLCICIVNIRNNLIDRINNFW